MWWIQTEMAGASSGGTFFGFMDFSVELLRGRPAGIALSQIRGT